jgi:hypothetical protein
MAVLLQNESHLSPDTGLFSRQSSALCMGSAQIFQAYVESKLLRKWMDTHRCSSHFPSLKRPSTNLTWYLYLAWGLQVSWVCVWDVGLHTGDQVCPCAPWNMWTMHLLMLTAPLITKQKMLEERPQVYSSLLTTTPVWHLEGIYLCNNWHRWQQSLILFHHRNY